MIWPFSFFGYCENKTDIAPDLDEKLRQGESEIAHERGELRQKVQELQSSVRLTMMSEIMTTRSRGIG